LGLGAIGLARGSYVRNRLLAEKANKKESLGERGAWGEKPEASRVEDVQGAEIKGK